MQPQKTGRHALVPTLAATLLFSAGATHLRADIVYVSDSNANAGTISTIPTGGGTPTTFASGFQRPEGLAFTPAGTLYVDNQLTGEIDRVDSTGNVSLFVTISGGFVGGMISDRNGNLYVSLQHQGVIDEITPSGAISPYATGTASPQGLAFDALGNLYVGSPNTNDVYKIAPGGGTAQIFAHLNAAVGIAVDASGNIYAGDATDGYIEKYSPAGTDLGQYAAVANPAGMTFDTAGQLLVASSDRLATGFDVYAIAPGGGTPTVYASGFNGPFYLTDPSLPPLLLPGDANADGKVDLSDLNIVLNHLGESDTSRADGNFDNAPTIDLTDLNDVLNNLGLSVPGSSAQLSVSPLPTPEPSTLFTLSFSALLMARRRPRR